MKTIQIVAAVVMLLASTVFSVEPAKAPKLQYVFRAELVRVVEADTVEMNIDLGFGIWKHGERLHLLGVQAPEKTEAAKAKTRLENLLEGKAEILVQTVKDKEDSKRYWATIWADGVNVNEALSKPQ